MKLVVVAVFACGCSFIGVRGPEKPDDPTKCRGSVVSPVIDAAVGAAGLIGGGVMLVSASGDDDKDYYGHELKTGGGAVAVAYGVLYAASAVYGAITVGECRDARRRIADGS